MSKLDEAAEVGEALMSLLSDGYDYTLSKLRNGRYDVAWWDELHNGVDGDTLLEAIRKAIEERKLEKSDE